MLLMHHGHPTSFVSHPPMATRRAIEWPTLSVAAVIYVAFAALTWYYRQLPWWFVLPVAAYLLTWHGSLQHEATHGHPTRWSRVNELIVLPSLWLWLPYRVYRDTHLAHHYDEYLTDPLNDPESSYTTKAQWTVDRGITRALLWANNTVAGRAVLGPWINVIRMGRNQIPRLLRGERKTVLAWAWHGLGCAIVLTWTLGVCNISLLDYILLFVYPGMALSLLRSFAEHRAAAVPAQRSAIVETSWPLALVFLYNNLHALHHREPWLAWYRLPGRYRAERDTILQENGNYLFSGYSEIVARYLLWPKEPVAHPDLNEQGPICTTMAPVPASGITMPPADTERAAHNHA